YAVDAGLDTAIVNPAHLKPYAELSAEEIKICEDLIFDRDEDALSRLIQFYEHNVAAETDTRLDPTEGLTVAQRLHWKIVHRKKDGVEADIDILMGAGLEPRGLALEDDASREQNAETQA